MHAQPFSSDGIAWAATAQLVSNNLFNTGTSIKPTCGSCETNDTALWHTVVPRVLCFGCLERLNAALVAIHNTVVCADRV